MVKVLSVIPESGMPAADWPATVVVPCGMGDARNLIMALAGDACIVIGGRAGTISEVCLGLAAQAAAAAAGGGRWLVRCAAGQPAGRARQFADPAVAQH